MPETTDRRDDMQRIRVGLTGLAGVLVLVLLAAAMLGLRSAEVGRGHARTAADRAAAAPKDPLAELGVTPGGTTEDPVAEPRPSASPPRGPTPPRPAPATH